MPAAKKTPARPTATPFSLPVPFAPKTPRPRVPRKPAAVQSAEPALLPLQKSAPDALSATAETNQPKRRRLAKAFERPLDKELRTKPSADAATSPKVGKSTVRDGFTFPKAEHDRLVELKKQLAEQGVTVKKSDLIRAGLILALSMPQTKLKSVLSKLPPVK